MGNNDTARLSVKHLKDRDTPKAKCFEYMGKIFYVGNSQVERLKTISNDKVEIIIPNWIYEREFG